MRCSRHPNMQCGGPWVLPFHSHNAFSGRREKARCNERVHKSLAPCIMRELRRHLGCDAPGAATPPVASPGSSPPLLHRMVCLRTARPRLKLSVLWRWRNTPGTDCAAVALTTINKHVRPREAWLTTTQECDCILLSNPPPCSPLNPRLGCDSPGAATQQVAGPGSCPPLLHRMLRLLSDGMRCRRRRHTKSGQPWVLSSAPASHVAPATCCPVSQTAFVATRKQQS